RCRLALRSSSGPSPAAWGQRGLDSSYSASWLIGTAEGPRQGTQPSPFILASASTCHTSATHLSGGSTRELSCRYRLNRRPGQLFTSFLETWGYLAVFVLSFISSMGLPVGAEVAIIYGGVLASGQIANEPHHLNVVAVIGVALLAEVLGSFAGYLIGYFGGRALVDRA